MKSAKNDSILKKIPWIFVGLSVLISIALLTVVSVTVYVVMSFLNEIQSIISEQGEFCCSFLSNISDSTASETFMAAYYSTQSNWLNFWLTFLGILLALMGVIFPSILFYSYNKKENKIDETLKNLNSVVREVDAMRNLVFLNREISKGKYDIALEKINELFEYDPKNIHAFTYLAHIYLNTKDYTNCIRIAQHGLAHHPSDIELVTNLSYAYINEDKCEKGIKYLEEANSTYPNQYTIILNLTHCYNDTAKYDETINLFTLYSDSLEDKEQIHHDLHYNVAKAYLANTKIHEALIHIEKYTKKLEDARLKKLREECPCFDEKDREFFINALKFADEKNRPAADKILEILEGFIDYKGAVK